MSDPAVQQPTAETPPRPRPRRFYVPQLDGLRFLAFLLVFIHHGPQLATLFPPTSLVHKILLFLQQFGWCGVDLFLVLSAFLITSLLLLEHEQHGSISLRGFYLRRILRIWPLYYLMTVIGFFLLPALALFAPPWGSAGHMQAIKDHLLAYCTLFGNYTSGSRGYPGIATLAHLWTVTLEEQFYIAWPLVLSLMLRTRRALLWGLLVSLLAGTILLRLNFIGRSQHPFIWTHTLARLDPLLVGIALALWRKVKPPRAGWLAPTVKLALGIALVVSIKLGGFIQAQSLNVAWQFLATALGFGLVLDAILSREGNPFCWLLSRRPLVWLGKLTYGLYVYHVISLQIGQEILVRELEVRHIISSPAAVLPVRFAVSLLLTIAISALSYRLFESYFLRLKDRFSRVQSRPVDPRST